VNLGLQQHAMMVSVGLRPVACTASVRALHMISLRDAWYDLQGDSIGKAECTTPMLALFINMPLHGHLTGSGW